MPVAKKIAKRKSRLTPRRAPNPAPRATLTLDSRLRDAENYLLPTYKRAPFILTHGRGCYVFDAQGKKYLDFLGGIAVNALGHAHPRILKTIRRAAAKGIHFSNLYHHAFQGPLAKKLAELSGLDRVFFANSGTEAIDGAMKLARLCAREPGDVSATVPKKHRFLAMENSFHGRTFGAISITATEKYRAPFSPVVPGVEFVRWNDVADLEKKFDDTVCGIILETVQGEGGIYPVAEQFWNRAHTLAARHGALLIADEIQCGLGRTGRYFAYQKFSAKPDIAVLAKPLAAGLPLGAILTNQSVADRISPGLHGTTFGGGPLICAVALEFLRVIEEQNLLDNIRARSAELRAGLSALAKSFPIIREIRVEGLMIGVQLSVEGAPLVAEAARLGLLINCTHDFTIRLLPPFIISKTHVREFLKLFEQVLASAAGNSSGADFPVPISVAKSAGVRDSSRAARAATR